MISNLSDIFAGLTVKGNTLKTRCITVQFAPVRYILRCRTNPDVFPSVIKAITILMVRVEFRRGTCYNTMHIYITALSLTMA